MSTYKVVIIGDFGVGKTSLTRRYVLDQFGDKYRATLGVKLYKFSDDVDVEGDVYSFNFVLWDIEGATIPNSVIERYFMGAAGAIVVGDASRADPSGPMVAYGEAFEEKMPGRPVVFAFNKTDLLDQDDPKAHLNVDELTHRFGGEVLLTSALTGDGVKELFRALAKQILLLQI